LLDAPVKLAARSSAIPGAIPCRESAFSLSTALLLVVIVAQQLAIGGLLWDRRQTDLSDEAARRDADRQRLTMRAAIEDADRQQMAMRSVIEELQRRIEMLESERPIC